MTTTKAYAISEEFFYDYIQVILFYTWDPMHMSRYRLSDKDFEKSLDGDLSITKIDTTFFAYGIKESEYDYYVQGVMRLVIKRKSVHQIYKHLRYLETKRMGCGNPIVTKIAAQRLFEIGEHISRLTLAQNV